MAPPFLRESTTTIKVENEVDDEPLAPIQYITTSVPGDGLNHGDYLSQYSGCACEDLCMIDTCPCIRRYGPNYNASGFLIPPNLDNHFSRPILECNNDCSCSLKCINRLVQKGLRISLCIFKTELKGWGVKTLQFIPKYSFVCEYAGEILGEAIAKERTAELKDTDANYLIVVKEHMPENRVLKTFVDPKLKGNVGRYINHSCCANLLMMPVRINTPIPKLCLFASTDIQPGQELTFNYGGDTKSATPHTGTRSKFEPVARKPCVCKSEVCRGFLPYEVDLFA